MARKPKLMPDPQPTDLVGVLIAAVTILLAALPVVILVVYLIGAP